MLPFQRGPFRFFEFLDNLPSYWVSDPKKSEGPEVVSITGGIE
jgi:hypothetical protein